MTSTKAKPTNENLTDTRVRKFKPEAKLYRVWDAIVPGFHVQITPGGNKAFRVQFQRSGGAKVQVTLGEFPSLSTEAAREKARILRQLHRDGRDIKAHLLGERKAQDLDDLVKIWRADFAPRLKKTTQDSYESIIKTTLLPALGSRFVKDLGYEDVKNLYRDARERTPTQANRAVAVLSKLFSIAETEGMRPDGSNPCRKVSREADKPRKRIFTAAELAKLEGALSVLVNEGRIELANADLIRFIAFSGLRRTEAMRLRFDDFDLDQNTMTFTEHKTDSAGDKVLPLNTHLRLILKRHSDVKVSPYLFPGIFLDRPFNGLGKVWERIRAKADLVDITPHDLRRTFMSTCTELGYPPAIGDALLGHSLGKIRDTYINLGPDGILAQATQETADWVASALAGQAPKRGKKIATPREPRKSKTRTREANPVEEDQRIR